MPIIKSAKKRVKQSEKRRLRNYPVRSLMKTNIKKVLVLSKEGKKADAEKMLQVAYKTIDTAAKKNIIHKNNAARKKSRLAKAVANIKAIKTAPAIKAAPGASKASSKERATASEAEAKKAPKKVEKTEEKAEKEA